MTKRNDEPTSLGEVLHTLAGRLRRVDLRVIDEAQKLWPLAVEPALAQHCGVEMIKDRVLVVRVPSGAFAQRVRLAEPDILQAFRVLGDAAPTSVKTVMKTPTKST